MVVAGDWDVDVPEGYLVSRWRVGRPIGRGGWGSVYEAWPDGDGEAGPVAVKFIPTRTVSQRQLAHLAEMARRELAAYQVLRHPRLIQFLDAVVIDDPGSPLLDGAVALVTERAECSLADRIAEAAGGPAADGPRILAEACEGLAHMHAEGWVHGDLKPSNVLLMADGSVRLADFGLATEIDGTHGYAPPVGSTDYLPPERWSERLTIRGIAVRESADIWALGVLACQLLTGRMPFPGPTARARAASAASYAASGDPAPRLAGLDPGWRSFIADCLAPDHATRQQHGTASLLARLSQAAELLPATVLPSTVPSRRARGRRGRAALLMAGTALALAAAFTGGTLWATRTPPAPADGALRGDGTPLPAPDSDPGRYLNLHAGIPGKYVKLIVIAGAEKCREPGVSPALVAAILKAESGFNAAMADKRNEAYGIAGWTPGILPQFAYASLSAADAMRAAMTPGIAIPAVGAFLCMKAPVLSGAAGGNLEWNLAAAYQSSSDDVLLNKISPAIRAFADEVTGLLARYRPAA
jgi:hypothetical protein